jgi:hypothetical protein
VQYDSALPYREAKVKDKINNMNIKAYNKPHEYIARNITYGKPFPNIKLTHSHIEMNKNKVHSVNWILGDDHSHKAKNGRWL